jgi:hypothetical protein
MRVRLWKVLPLFFFRFYQKHEKVEEAILSAPNKKEDREGQKQ